MDMKNYIEKAEKKAGKQTELANILGITTSYIRNVKAGKSGLPVEICIVLADYINEDRLEVIAASNLVTEKDERKRKIFESCFEKTNRAASFLIAAIFVAVISITSPNPANASQVTISHVHNLYYVKWKNSILNIINMLSDFVFDMLVIASMRVRNAVC